MPQKLYETLIAFDSTRMSAEPDAIRNAIHGNIEKLGGQIIVARPWDENGKLLYPIRKQKKAYFYILYYNFESTKQAELEREFAINENILRQLTSLIDPKWAENFMEVAKNDSGTRFALKTMQDDSAPTGEGIISNDPMARGEMMDGPPREGGGRGRGRRNDYNDKPE
ncbi:MAG: 30S ribosomal protein S6 [Gemmataceae bacterium]